MVTKLTTKFVLNWLDKIRDKSKPFCLLYQVVIGEEIIRYKDVSALFNETGQMQVSFDGLEGVWSTGMGQYARGLFTKTWYDNLKPKLKGKVPKNLKLR